MSIICLMFDFNTVPRIEKYHHTNCCLKNRKTITIHGRVFGTSTAGNCRFAENTKGCLDVDFRSQYMYYIYIYTYICIHAYLQFRCIYTLSMYKYIYICTYCNICLHTYNHQIMMMIVMIIYLYIHNNMVCIHVCCVDKSTHCRLP